MMTELQQPGYLHVLLNHLPIIGTGAGLFGLVVALFLRSRQALVPALAILIVAGVSAWPVNVTGHSAYRPLMKISDDPGRDWLDEHEERSESTTWVFYAMAGVAAVALAAPAKWPRSAIPLSILAGVFALAGLAAGGYIAQAGGLIRHVEFRVPGQSAP
ncbi:MAG: hypothetical protein WCH98_03405 [Verrucomicrobiota bacterium]